MVDLGKLLAYKWVLIFSHDNQTTIMSLDYSMVLNKIEHKGYARKRKQRSSRQLGK